MKYDFEEINANDFEEKWKEFSNIQCAEYLIIDSESMNRFRRWVKTENPDDAWS